MTVSLLAGMEQFSSVTTLENAGKYHFSRNPLYPVMFLVLFVMAFLVGGVGALLAGLQQ